jgi:hypothetical protein
MVDRNRRCQIDWIFFRKRTDQTVLGGQSVRASVRSRSIRPVFGVSDGVWMRARRHRQRSHPQKLSEIRGFTSPMEILRQPLKELSELWNQLAEKWHDNGLRRCSRSIRDRKSYGSYERPFLLTSLNNLQSILSSIEMLCVCCERVGSRR